MAVQVRVVVAIRFMVDGVLTLGALNALLTARIIRKALHAAETGLASAVWEKSISLALHSSGSSWSPPLTVLVITSRESQIQRILWSTRIVTFFYQRGLGWDVQQTDERVTAHSNHVIRNLTRRNTVCVASNIWEHGALSNIQRHFDDFFAENLHEKKSIIG